MRSMFQDPLIADALLVMEAGPEDPGYDAAWSYLLKCRDPKVQAMLRRSMEAVYGPMPPATGYNDEGEAFWTTEVIANYLGTDVAAVDALVEDVYEQYEEAAGVTETSKLHRVH
ncbi:MAG: hypothetical protein HQL64_17410 [Magnetococcales bacterium]|nr:hypothetical protein [Magnetococcales bacterium]